MSRTKPKLHFRHHEFLDSTTYRACCDIVDVCVNRDLLKAITEEKHLKDDGLLVRFHWDTTESYSANHLSTITLYQGEKDSKTVFSPEYAVTLARSNFILHEFACEMLQVYNAKLVAVQYPHLAMTFHHDKVFETSIFTSNKLQLYTTLKGLASQCCPTKKPMQLSLKIDKGSRVTLPQFTPCQCLVNPRSAVCNGGLEKGVPGKQDCSTQTKEASLESGNDMEMYTTVSQNIDDKFLKMEFELTDQKEHIEKHFQEQKKQTEEMKSILVSLQHNLERDNLTANSSTQINGDTGSHDGQNAKASSASRADRTHDFRGQNSSIIKRDAAKMKKAVKWNIDDFQDNGQGKDTTFTKNQISRYQGASRPASTFASGSSGENMPMLETRTPSGSQYSPYSHMTSPYSQTDGYSFQTPQETVAPDYSDLQTQDLNFPIVVPLFQRKTMRLAKKRLSDETDGMERFDILVDSIIADSPDRKKLRQKVNEAVVQVRRSAVPYVETVTDTIICIDTSARIGDGTLEHMKTCAMEFINAIEDIAEQYELEENIGIVGFGGEPTIVHCLSNDYGSLRDALEEITAEGQAHVVEGLLLALACSSKGGELCMGELIKLQPRLILLTDGQGNRDMTEDNEDHVRIINAFKQFQRRQPQDYLQGDVLVIPFGQSKSTMRSITQACGGKMIDKTNLTKLAKHQKMHKLASHSLEVMRNNSANIYYGKMSKLTLEFHPDMQDHERGDVESILNQYIVDAPMNYGTIGRFDNLVMVDGLPPLGSRIVRGVDWKWKNQDTEGAGTIYNHGCDSGWLFVVWDNSVSNVYRYGKDNCYDVQLTTDQPRQPGGEPMFFTGFLVERGPDWNVTYRNQDGGPGSRGVIIRERQDIGRVMVRWENGEIFEYRYGENNMFDISMLDPIASLIRDADG